ncbi:hypothetical protein KP509_29G038800 [Ceratopteris richardii]|uniref:protein-tyrosine-phosphatase n=1 Tax=Ceratopteris richardii TaxID=49495 RepID=A0A8T2R767_CERRI|nr:hypothetical protein KP509_29G038800 [Ceratopteris richardii]
MQLIDRGHWSLIIVDFNAYQALFLNSLPSQHGNCKVAAKLLKMHIDQNFLGIAKMNEQKQFGYSQIHVPLQRDSTSCGWRVIANAVYEPFYADFGPLNFACTYHFCMKLTSLLEEGGQQGHCVCFCSSSEPKKKPNAAVLLGAYLVLCEGWDAETAYNPLSEFEPFLPFRDPTCGISTYHLSVLDCIRALSKGKRIGWIDLHTFNVKEYEYFEQVENGDLTWIVPNKIVAFSGPSARRIELCGYRTLVPEDYVSYFKQSKITTIIRLNKRLYDKRRFTDHGLAHHDLYFPDGSCPPERIVQRFLEIVDDCTGAVAVHCKAGLGRTGVLIGCYLMRNFRFTANEAIGYLRVLRPGSVIGPQQHFLRDMQSRMWKAGDTLRRQRSENNRSNRMVHANSSQDNHHSRAAERSASLSSPLAALSLTGTQSWSQNRRTVLDSTGNDYRRSFSQDGMQLRSNASQRSTCQSFSRGSGSLCLSMDSSIEQNRRPSSGNEVACRPSYNLRSQPSTMQPSNFETNGMWSSGVKPPAAEGVCTQRTLNAAGQPRKVVVPVNQLGTRDCSPLRRKSTSPLRYVGNQD